LNPQLEHLLIPSLNINSSSLRHFSSLIELETKNWNGDDADVALLPRTLTTLKFVMNSNLDDLGASNLPSGLTWLEMASKKLTDEGVGLLPRGLTHLELGWRGKRSDVSIQNLPRSLKILKMLWNNSAMTSKNGFAQLPRGLEYLHINTHESISFRQQDLPNLPLV
jgi:hypothetical protein